MSSSVTVLFLHLPPKFPHDIRVSRLPCQQSQHSQPFRDGILLTNTSAFYKGPSGICMK